jgi:glucokinase
LSRYVVAADIGGSHITAAVIDTDQKVIEGNTLVRIPVSNTAETAELIADWATCIKKTDGLAKADQICLAMPGPFDYDKGICYIRDQAKYPGLYGANVKDLLSRELDWPEEKIFMQNDAACFIEGEVFCGSMEGFNEVIGITLGTGLGTAVYRNNSGLSADLWDAPFKDGIAEDYISSRWFVAKYKELTGEEIGGVRDLVSPGMDEAIVQAIFTEFAENLAAFLKEFAAKEKPQAVVLGGNIAKAFNVFQDRLTLELAKHHPAVLIRQSQYGENAALLGAASSWINSLGKKPGVTL